MAKSRQEHLPGVKTSITPSQEANRCHLAAIEQRLITWASRRHPGKARDWLLSHYWRRDGTKRRVFATDDGIRLRGYRQRRILGG
ncbi:MAG TPA: hypothetical protein VF844_00915 [Ktedonobacteraceae bacterium]